MVHNLTSKELDTLVRITHAEAGKESQLGQVAVLHVIKNRVEANRGEFGGGTVQGVVNKPWQFEPTMTDVGRRNMQNVSGKKYEDLEKLAEGVFSGQIPDPTGGSTHFANVGTVKQRRGGGITDWMRDKAATAHDIGNHTFFGGDKQQAEKVTQQLQQTGFHDVVTKWQAVLKSSPDHVMEELTALGDNEKAKEILDELKKSPTETKTLTKAVEFLEAQAKEQLKHAGVATTGRNIAVAEMLGGKTAVALLKADPSAKVSTVIDDPKILAAAGKLMNKENIGDISVADFLGAIDAEQQKDKRQIADKARGNLSQGNQNFLDQMMNGEMGMMEFLMLFVMLLVMDGAGLDMGGRGQQAPQQQQEQQQQQPSPPKAQEYNGEIRTPIKPPVTQEASVTAPTAPLADALQGANFIRNASVTGGYNYNTNAPPPTTPEAEKNSIHNRASAPTAAL